MKVSVIIPTYNSSNYILESINSVLSQTYTNFEIIVVDDGSTDNTKKLLAKYIKNKKITYFYQKNKGQAAARNFAIEKSSGELIAFLDSDDLWTKDKLEKQLELFKDETVGLVYGGVEWFNELGNIKQNKPTLKGKIFNKLIIHNPITTSSVIIRKKAFEFFNETKEFHGVEDYDVWLKISKNWVVNYVSDIVCKYRIHSLSTSVNLEKRYNNELNVKKQFFSKFSVKFVNRSLWDTNYNTAYSLNKLKNYKESFKYLKNAFKNLPFEVKNYKLLIKNIMMID